MPVEEIPLCSICEKPMVALPERTDQGGEQIWVCATPKRVPGSWSKKMPCDGGLAKNSGAVTPAS